MRSARTKAISLLAAAALGAGLYLVVLSGTSHQAKAENGESQIQQGYEIAPVQLNLEGKNRALVGLGSYYVNSAAHCSGCHTWPNWAPGHDPFQGQPKQTNLAGYLAGGRPFVPPGVISRDITPYENGMPAGLTLAQFAQVLRTGHDPDKPGRLLQIMPWPMLRKLTDRDIAAIYEYLRAIPPIEPGPGVS